MNVPLFMRILAAFILCLSAYYLSMEYHYVLGGLSLASVHQVIGLLWYVFSGLTAFHLFRLSRNAWVWGNAWLSYGAVNIISSYIFLEFLVPDENYQSGSEGIGLPTLMFIFYGALWFLLNTRTFTGFFRLDNRTRVMASLVPAIVVFVLLLYNLSYFL